MWRSFPEILAVQVPHLIGKMKEESAGVTRKQFREKVATLSQSQLLRATDTLAMIWDGMVGPLDLPTLEPKPYHLPNPLAHPSRVKFALLRSISTGTFIDVQFFAYNTISNGLPVDLRPLYTSSIVIERWRAAITTRKLESFFGSTQF